ncbi:MAG: hypothetical protein IIZ78_24075 [Clostridiales bacterium]|nr:hypothetical protein [Clostridiales bacterium]
MAEKLCELKKKGGGGSNLIRIKRMGPRLYSGGTAAVIFCEIFADNHKSVSVGTIDSHLTSHYLSFYDSNDTRIGERITMSANSTYQIPSGTDYMQFNISTTTGATTAYWMNDIIIE